jgi:microcystin-dependent protein
MYIASTPPAGWLLCDGQQLIINNYPRLFAIIGFTYGGDTLSGKFILPNFQGCVPVGVGTAAAAGATAKTLGQYGGEETHVLDITEMPSHSHSYDRAASNQQPDGNNTFLNYFASYSTGQTSVTGGPTGTTGTNIAVAHNNMPPFVVVNYIIKF